MTAIKLFFLPIFLIFVGCCCLCLLSLQGYQRIVLVRIQTFGSIHKDNYYSSSNSHWRTKSGTDQHAQYQMLIESTVWLTWYSQVNDIVVLFYFDTILLYRRKHTINTQWYLQHATTSCHIPLRDSICCLELECALELCSLIYCPSHNIGVALSSFGDFEFWLK